MLIYYFVLHDDLLVRIPYFRISSFRILEQACKALGPAFRVLTVCIHRYLPIIVDNISIVPTQ